MNERIAFQVEPFELYESASPSLFSSLAALPQTVLRALRAGRESIAVQLSIAQGKRDVNTLTNMVFHARHPERKGKTLARREPGFDRLAREWRDIRDRLVKPALLRAQKATTPVRPRPPPPTAQAPGGDVVVKRVSPSKKRRSLEEGVKTDKTAPFRPDLRDPRDVVLAATAATEGGYDTVNMYDRGILSWGIMQWTVHAGSLQRALAYIKSRMAQLGQADLWSRLFPGLDVQRAGSEYRLTYQGRPMIDRTALRRLFRGHPERGRFDERTIRHWAQVFARAGRHPLAQQLQQEHARREVDRALKRNLGQLYGSRYGRARDYVRDRKAMVLYFGMWTNNPRATYRHLKAAIDNLARRYNTHDITRWPASWPAALSAEFERVLRASSFGYWGDAKARAAGRTSRTAKILSRFHSLAGQAR